MKGKYGYVNFLIKRGNGFSMKMKKGKIVFYAALFIVLITMLITVTYGVLRSSVKNIVIQNANEISEHDMRNIQAYISVRLNDMNNIITELKLEQPESIGEVQKKINIKVRAGLFSRIYLISEDGLLYADNFLIYDKDENDFMSYFNDNNGLEFARRYDDDRSLELEKEYLLYGINFKNDPVELAGTRFVGAVALNDISEMQDKMRITGLNGKSFSSVINRDGYYIVSADRKSGYDRLPNFYDVLEECTPEKGITVEDIRSRIARLETLEFAYTDKNGTDKYISVKPIENTNWCFVNSIETSVFNDQTFIFMVITMSSLLTMIVILVFVFIVIYLQRRKLKNFYLTTVEGVFNRRYYNDKLTGRYIKSLIMVDLDYLKHINDGFGHLAGDLSIASVANVLRRHIGSSGDVVRYGGDEFVVAFREKPSEEEFMGCIDNILKDMREVRLDKFPEIRLTLSIGGVYGEGVTEELFNSADELLYEAKKTRNCAVTNLSAS